MATSPRISVPIDPLTHRIALVEDNPADAEMLKVALEQTDFAVEIVVLPDGAEALKYLTSATPARPPCDLLILDLNLPRMNGLEVLEKVREVDYLKALPVVVMSGSKNRAEIDRCYALGANAYVYKSNDLDEIYARAKRLMDFWFDCAKLPGRNA